MQYYNILGDNEVSISDLLWLDTITLGQFRISTNIVALKRGNHEPILTVKSTEWRKLIDSFGLIIAVDPSRVGKSNGFFHIRCITIPSSVNLHLSSHHMYKEILFVTMKALSITTNKNLAAEIVPYISSALRKIQMGKIFCFFVGCHYNLFCSNLESPLLYIHV